MTALIKYTTSSFSELDGFERCDLSYSVFNDVDFRSMKFPTSFFRSDFRGTQFAHMYFFKNNFDRSDFINAVLKNCTFEHVNLGCCQIKNCYFENVNFQNNLYRYSSIHSTVFKNCNFQDESFLINMQQCEFIDCKFMGCSFEMSTTDSDIFEKSTFNSCNFATMHAENHLFIDCILENMYFDESYYFGYNISNCTQINVYFLYRGKKKLIESVCSVEDYLNKLKNNHRYNECLNLLKLLEKMKQPGKFEQILPVLQEAFNYFNENQYGRKLEIENIFNTLTFMIKQEELDFKIAYNIVDYFESMDWTQYPENELESFILLLNKLKRTLFCIQHSDEYLIKNTEYDQSLFKIEFENDNFDFCLNTAKSIFKKMQPSTASFWRLIDCQKGSLLLTFVVPTAILVSVLPRIIRQYSNIYFEIKLKKHLTNTAIALLKSPNSEKLLVQKWQNIANTAITHIVDAKDDSGDIIKDIKSITANV